MVTYNTMSTDLPLHHNEEKPKKCWRIIDYSEPFFGISAVSGIIGIVVNVISTENFDIYLGVVCSIMSFIGLWRVRVLGVAKKLMDSVDALKLENMRLNRTQHSLEEENEKLKQTNESLKRIETKLNNDVNDLRSVMNIIDTQNKTADEIQKEMLTLVEKYYRENSRQERNNKIALFYTADMNRDGLLEGEELDVLKEALRGEYDIDDLDFIFKGTMSRKSVLEKLFKNA